MSEGDPALKHGIEASFEPITREERRERLSFAITASLILNRNLNGMTAADLARQVGVSKNTIGRWIKGTSTPAAYLLGPLADALQVPSGWLANPPAIPEYEIPRIDGSVSRLPLSKRR